MLKRITLITALAGCATGLYAHSGVNNATVLARMHGMKTIGDAMKVLGGMAKGAVAFDAAQAQAALATVSAEAAQIPVLFDLPEQDPKSEALPAIWDNWEDFLAKSEALEAAAQGAQVTAASDLGAALGQLGGACKACHSAYRE